MRLAAAKFIHVAHLAIVVLALTGWAVLDGPWLRLYGAGLVVILIQWLLLQNRCVLTVWEHRLRHGSRSLDRRSENTFVGRAIHQCTGKMPSYLVVNLVAYGLLGLVIILTWWRVAQGA